MSEDKLIDLLVQWGEAREQGQQLSVDDLCADCPELASDLAERIKNVEVVRPFIELDDDSDDDFLHLPDFTTISGQADETKLPECSMSVDEFTAAIIDSDLMEAADIERLKKGIDANDARSFAMHLVSDKKLTRFQAVVLLDGRDIPLVLDRYVLLDEIGAGGMGAVYKALHQQMDRVVALKILPKSAVDSPDKVKRFQREVKAAAKLEHSNIVTAFDAHEDKGIHFLVMSYVTGSDLSVVVRKQGPLSAARAVNFMTQAAQGLQHAHNIGIVHRDIKPANLLLDRQGTVKILDMGLARIENADPEHDKTVSQELTQAGMVMGTIAYLAPEQALDTRSADARSDIYSLGCTLYYLLTGNALFVEDTMMKTIMAHSQSKIPSLSELREGIPEELDAVFQKMVAKKPEDRFQNMAEVITALEELEIEEEEPWPIITGTQAAHETNTFVDTSRASLDPTIASRSAEPPRRRWGLIAGGLFGLVLLAGLIIKLTTPAGTVILEVDQPELIGAVVTIDGEKKITIKTGEGKEPIEITPDEKRHELEIKIAGFKTFSKEFTFETGNKQTIRVRLEPLDAVAKKYKAEGQPAVDGVDIASMKGLTELNWAYKNVSDSDLHTLGILQTLSSLNLARTQVTGAGLSSLSGLKKLKQLNLGNTPVTFNGLQTLKQLPQLESLDLRNTNLSGDEFRVLSHCTNLSSLTLLQTKIDDPALLHLAELENLTVLDLRLTPVSQAGVDQLKKTLPKCKIEWDGGTIEPANMEVVYTWPKDQPAPAIAPFNAEEAQQHQEEWAKHLGVEVETTNSIGMKLRVIPPGEFLMGSSEEEIAKLLEEAKEQKVSAFYIEQIPHEGPQHRVTLTKPFGSSIHEVTRGQFRQFVEATDYKTDAEKDGKGGYGWKDGKFVQATEFLWNTAIGFTTQQTDDHPVVNVSWNDTVEFCKWLSEKEGVFYRLPTESEWEFVCRAGSLSRFAFGDEESLLEEYAWYAAGGSTKPVGQKAANALGLFDLHGNVWEWCHDWFGPYTTTLAIDPVGPPQGYGRLLRGGSYGSPSSNVRSSIRANRLPTDRADTNGFRIVRTFEKYKPKSETVNPPKSAESSKLESTNTSVSEESLESEKKPDEE